MKSGVFAKALAEGDPVARSLIDEAVEAVGVAIADAVVLLDIDLVVLGGGVAEKLGAELVGRVEAGRPRPRLRRHRGARRGRGPRRPRRRRRRRPPRLNRLRSVDPLCTVWTWTPTAC